MPKTLLPQTETDMKWKKTMNYIDLMFKYIDTRRILWREYPEEMRESANNFAKKWVNAGLIKCKHEE